jgi:hypothetical protein
MMEALWQLGVAPSTTLGRDELLRFASSLEALNASVCMWSATR